MRDADIRDARPFLAHHLRERADERMATNGPDLHSLARWVENLPSDDQRMGRVAAAADLDYNRGTFHADARSEALIDGFRGGDDVGARDQWLDNFAAAMARMVT